MVEFVVKGFKCNHRSPGRPTVSSKPLTVRCTIDPTVKSVYIGDETIGVGYEVDLEDIERAISEERKRAYEVQDVW